MPNTHRRRYATVELSLVGVDGVYWSLANCMDIVVQLHFISLDVISVDAV